MSENDNPLAKHQWQPPVQVYLMQFERITEGGAVRFPPTWKYGSAAEYTRVSHPSPPANSIDYQYIYGITS